MDAFLLGHGVQVSARQLATSFLSKGISNTLNFHENICNDGTLTSESPAPYRRD